MMVQVASSRVEPSIWVATGFFSLRYIMEKPNTRMPTAIRPTAEIAHKKK